MERPWTSFGTPEPGADLTGVVGEIRPSRYRTLPRIVRATRRIEAQLAGADGLVGYALRADVFARRFWAVSAWDDEASLQQFVAADPHAAIRTALKPAMETGRFETFAVSGDEVPLDVDDAIASVR